MSLPVWSSSHILKRSNISMWNFFESALLVIKTKFWKHFWVPKSPHLLVHLLLSLRSSFTKYKLYISKYRNIIQPKKFSRNVGFSPSVPQCGFFPTRFFSVPAVGSFLLLFCIFYSCLYCAVNKDHYYCTVVKESKSVFGIQLLSDFVLLSSHAIACE